MAVYVRAFIDFDRNGLFAGAYDDVSADLMSARWNIGARGANQSVGNAGRATLRLNDEAGIYNPDNAASPIYGKLRPRVNVKITVAQTPYSAQHVAFRGYVEAVRLPFDVVAGVRFVEVDCADIFGLLRDSVVELPLLENKRTDEIIETILRLVELPPLGGVGWRLGVAGMSELGVTTVLGDVEAGFDLQTGLYTASYAGDNWGNGISALSAIKSAVEAERGRFYFDREGRAVFKNRQYLQKLTTPAATITAAQSASRVFYEDLKNVVKVTTEPRKIETSVTLFELDEPIECKPNAQTKFSAKFTNSAGVEVAGRNLVTPSEGGGTLATTGGSISFEMTAKAKQADFVFDNPNYANVTITTLIITGDRLTSFGTVEAVAADEGLAFLDGRRELIIDGKLLDNLADGQNIANYEFGRLSTAVGYTNQISLMGDEAAAVFDVEVMDAVQISGVYPGIDETSVVVGEAHDWRADKAGATYRRDLFLESRQLGAFWLLGVTGYSELGISTRLGL